jgi:hypothetical protein
MNLVALARTIPSERLCFPDTLHFTKLMCNRGMDPATRLVPVPTIDFVFPVREFALGAGIPAPVLDPKRKLHDSNPLHIAYSNCLERAIGNGQPAVIAYFLPIILGIRHQFDVEERETLLNWRVLNFCFALLQLVLKEELAAKEFGWVDPKKARDVPGDKRDDSRR